MKNLIRVILISILLPLQSLLIAQDIVLEPESWSFPAVIEHARKISPNNIEGKPFNQFGLVYSSDELESIRISELDAQELQKYADIVTHAYPDAVAKQIPDSLDGRWYTVTEYQRNNCSWISIHLDPCEKFPYQRTSETPLIGDPNPFEKSRKQQKKVQPVGVGKPSNAKNNSTSTCTSSFTGRVSILTLEKNLYYYFR